MYLVALDDAAVGCRLGKSVRDASGHVLVRAGVRLDPGSIQSLLKRGYRTVYATDGASGEKAVPEAVREQTRVMATRIVKRTMERCASGRGFDSASVRRAVERIVADLRGTSELSLSVSAVRSVDEYTFVHSVNVCLYSLLLGSCMAYDSHDMLRLGVGALLHDVGKVRYTELVARPGPLSAQEFERLKGHTLDGYEILRRHHGVDLLSAHVAYQHHERLDGSGYPRGLRGEQIVPFARIVAIADVYDAMTADRPYSGAVAPVEAMATIQSQAGAKLDEYLVRNFARCVAVYPTGTLVLLQDRRVGVVCAQSESSASQPLVRILTDEHQNLVAPVEAQAGRDVAIDHVLRHFPARVREQFDRRRVMQPSA